MPENKSGWRISPYDGRDYLFTNTRRAEAVAGQRLFLDHPFAVRDQGEVPCCVSCAVVVCMEVLDAQHPPQTELSPLFHYYVTRPRPDRLVDLTIREGLGGAVTQGVCEKALHPFEFNRQDAMQPPSNAAQSDGLSRRLVARDPVTNRPAYYSLPDGNRVPAWVAALSRGMPLIVGFWLTANYWDLSPSRNVLDGSSSDTSDSGHAVAVLGVDEDREMFMVKDSRGAEFADQGHWWLPYRLVETRLVAEAWAVGRISF